MRKEKSNIRFWAVVTLFVLCCFNAVAQDIVENKSELLPGENIEEKIKKNFFLRADVTKTDCYVGEPLMAVFKAYSRLDANSQVLKRPSLSGFSVIEMVDAYSNEARVEKYRGENYNVHLIRKVQLFPIQPGTFTIEPAEVESVIHLRDDDGRSGLRNFFRRRRDDGLLDRQLTFTTPPVQIKVSALPVEEQPDDFSGAVGDFNVGIQMDDTIVVARQPAIVKLVISGTGNFPLVTEPHISWSPEAEISGPTVDEQVNKYSFPLSGMKTFQFTIVHRDSGSFSIPPVRFSFFDPVSKKYKTAESGELKYTVSQTAGHKADESGQMIFKNKEERPLHLYYFGIIVVVILGVIIFILTRKK
ncbi:MAG: BatD family protein [Chitinophagaceae bacterium]|nr:BatD family protein [Chitinophagaceae bacterium]